MPDRDEYGDIPGQGGSKWATMDTVLPEEDLHISGTRLEGTGFGGTRLTFFLYNPPYRQEPCRVRCGICQRVITRKHCDYCYPERNEAHEGN